MQHCEPSHALCSRERRIPTTAGTTCYSRDRAEISFAVDSADHAQTHGRRNLFPPSAVPPPACKHVHVYTRRRISGVDRGNHRWMFMTRLRAVAPSFSSRNKRDCLITNNRTHRLPERNSFRRGNKTARSSSRK